VTATQCNSPLVLGTHTFESRLIVGTGKYATYELMRDCLDAAGAEVVTVAVRRERLIDAQGRSILDFLDLSRYTILPNTAGCFSADDAIRVARLGREILLGLENSGADWVKLEVLGDKKTLLPDPVATLEATGQLVKEGFQVLCYTTDDPVTARRLKEAGATSVMPAGSPIGSGQGVLNPNNIRICLEYLKENDPEYPVIIDAGVGTASDVSFAMELGCDGVLLNTGIAGARDPLLMAEAMRLACIGAALPREGDVIAIRSFRAASGSGERASSASRTERCVTRPSTSSSPRPRRAPASADVPGARLGSWQRLHLDRKHGRKIADDGSPVVAGIGRGVNLPARGAEIHAARIERIDGHGVAQHVDVAVALRQAFGERLPLVSARAAAVHAQLSLGRKVLRVALDRDHVDGFRLVRVNVDHEAEIGRQVPADLVPGIAGVVAAHHVPVLLHEQHFGREGCMAMR
jgi:thiazole synthase